MPDIQTAFKTALSRTLQQWDDDDGEVSPQASPQTTINNSVSQPSQNIQGIPMTKTFNVTNNISRETFQYIKDNPGSTRKEIIAALEHRGFASGSVSSLIAQMRRNNLIHETNSLYYADADEYRPLKSLKAIKKLEAKAKAAPVEVKPKRKYVKRATTEGIGALLKAKIESMPMPSSDALDAAAYAMGGNRPVLTKLVRTKSPESIIENMNVLQARELYDYLRKIFGG